MKTIHVICSAMFLLLASTYAVFNGIPAAPGQFAYMVYLMVDNGSPTTYACGGGLLNSRYVLSAGHCSWGGSFQVIVGRDSVRGYRKTDVVNVTKVTRPANYAKDGIFNYNDVAIFELETPVAEVPGKIQYLDVGLNAPPVGAPITLAGFGMLGPEETTPDIHYGTKYVSEDNTCKFYYYKPEVAFCTNDATVTACPGDSGSPVVVRQPGVDRWIAVGLESYVHVGACGLKQPDAVNSKLAAMTQFIQENTPLEPVRFVTISDWGSTIAPTAAPGPSVGTSTTAVPTAVPSTVAPSTTPQVETTSSPVPPTIEPTTAAPSTVAPSTATPTTTVPTTMPTSDAPTTTSTTAAPTFSQPPTAPGSVDTITPTTTLDPRSSSSKIYPVLYILIALVIIIV